MKRANIDRQNISLDIKMYAIGPINVYHFQLFTNIHKSFKKLILVKIC